MSQSQRNILFASAGVVFLMLIFPPYIVLNYAGVVLKNGYGFIFDIPVYPTSSGGIIAGIVDAKTLAIQIGGVALIGFACFAAMGGGKENEIETKAIPDDYLHSSQPTRRIGNGTGSLRFIRAVFAIVGLWQFLGLFPTVTWIGNPGLVTANMVFLVVFKFALGAACFGVASWLRNIINRRHEAAFGSPHPALANGNLWL